MTSTDYYEGVAVTNETKKPEDEMSKEDILPKEDILEDEDQGADETELDDQADGADDDRELSPLEAAEAERDALRDQLYRAVAEMENTKRRAQRDVESAHKYGPLGFIRDVTTPLDNLQRALESAPENRDDLDETYKNILIGLEMTVQDITKIMEKHGVEVIWPEGEKFDYNLHQAMFEVPTNDAEAGTVVTVVQSGYKLHDRLIRPAMVGVAKPAQE
ncbi:MAG: nucleotide exchange factor GrpE [Candidatus Puniceispirillaceae bacterium]